MWISFKDKNPPFDTLVLLCRLEKIDGHDVPMYFTGFNECHLPDCLISIVDEALTYNEYNKCWLANFRESPVELHYWKLIDEPTQSGS